jgi:hypothetical protein
MQTFCFIDSKNESNKCEDKNYVMIHDNKGNDVYKVNLNSGSNTSQSTNIGSKDSFNNNTQPYAHIGHDAGNNTTYTNKINTFAPSQ